MYMGHGGEQPECVKSNHGEMEGKAKMESDTRYSLVYIRVVTVRNQDAKHISTEYGKACDSGN